MSYTSLDCPCSFNPLLPTGWWTPWEFSFIAISPKPSTMLGIPAGSMKRLFFTTKSWHSKHRKLQPYRYHQNLVGWDSTVICKHWSPNTWRGDEIQKELYNVSNKQVYPVIDWVSATCQTSAIPWEERDTASPASQGGIHTLVIQTGYMPSSVAENERKARSKKHASIPIFRKGNTTNFATEPNFNSRWNSRTDGQKRVCGHWEKDEVDG